MFKFLIFSLIVISSVYANTAKIEKEVYILKFDNVICNNNIPYYFNLMCKKETNIWDCNHRYNLIRDFNYNITCNDYNTECNIICSYENNSISLSILAIFYTSPMLVVLVAKVFGISRFS